MCRGGHKVPENFGTKTQIRCALGVPLNAEAERGLWKLDGLDKAVITSGGNGESTGISDGLAVMADDLPGGK